MTSQKIPKKEEEKIKDEMEWIKACEAELNFQKAVDMATDFFSIKLEEDFKFMKNGFFCNFVFSKKMNPAKISIPECTLDTPVKKSSGKISFCLLPCLHKKERLQVKLQSKFKIFAHQGESFSLGINLPEENIKFFKDLEKHLNSLAIKKKSAMKELGPNFARFQEGDFLLLKTDKSDQE